VGGGKRSSQITGKEEIVNQGTQAVRDIVSSQLKSLADETAKMAAEAAERTAGKLNPIITPVPGTLAKGGEQPEEAWPPLFADLRTSLWSIRGSIASINETVSATEV
jgi:hypothetical protein